MMFFPRLIISSFEVFNLMLLECKGNILFLNGSISNKVVLFLLENV